MARYKNAKKGVGVGFGGASFALKDLLAVYTGFYGDLDAPLGIIRNTQDSLLNGTFASDTVWVKGAGWSIGAGQASWNAAVAANLSQACGLVAENHYLLQMDVPAMPGGSLTPYLGAGGPLAPISSTGAHVREGITTSATLYLQGSAGGVCSVDNVELFNLSLAGVMDSGALGNLSVAAATNMGWGSHPLAPTSVGKNGKYVCYFDGSNDYVAGAAGTEASWPLHKSAGFTFSVPFKTNVDGTALTLGSTASTALATQGIALTKSAANLINLRISNGSGAALALDFTSAATALAASWHVLTLSWSGAGGVRMLLDSAAVETAATTGAVGAGDASAPLNFARRSDGTQYFNGQTGSPLILIGAVPDPVLAQIHQARRAWYAI